MNRSKTVRAGKSTQVVPGRSKQENKPGLVKTTKPKLQRLFDHKTLAERNQAVMPVGAWVESGTNCHEHPVILASVTEEQHMELLREKEDRLRRFQEEVRRRVARQAWVRKNQQLQKSCEMAEHDKRFLQRSSEAVRRIVPQTGISRAHVQEELALCSPDSRWVSAQALPSNEGDGSGSLPRPGTQQEAQFRKVMRQVRHKLASCQTVPVGAEMANLPGGNWKVSLTEHSPPHQRVPQEREDEEISLTGQHDRPVRPQYPRNEAETSEMVCKRLLRDAHPTGPTPGFSTDYRATRVLWPGDNQEEMKRQRQCQFLMYRRLFMDVERAQVKEFHRHRKHQRRIERIKAEKEQKRLQEERKIKRLAELEEDREEMEEQEHLRQMEEQMLEEVERERKDREATRFAEALRAQMRDKMEQEKVELPPLCCCGETFWDSHPDTCANNCVFYSNPKAYAQALQSVLLSCSLTQAAHSRHGHRASARTIASFHALSPRK